MIMFYDVMLIDDDPVLHRPQKERRVLLENLVTEIKWKAGLVWHQEVDFSTPRGPKYLKRALAYAFVQRYEGLVLKPADEPYFDLARPVRGRFPSRWIKLKKDCIKGLGDTADFAVVGAGYHVKEAAKYPGIKLAWTNFYIGCLRNKEAVLRSGAKPRFLVFDKVSDCIKKDDLVFLNQHGQFPDRAMDLGSADAAAAFDVNFASGLARPKTLFRKPFVFDIAGSGFDKSPNRDIFTLRFPRVIKVHHDRDWKQAVSLDELQAMATEARTAPSKDLVCGEVQAWVEKLDQLDRGARDQRPSWDYSDDEEDDNGDPVEEASMSRNPKQPRRARTNGAPPFVRMDTEEMRDQERRMSSGEVVERPSSKHSMSSITSDGALQTPPTSSPLSKGSGNNPRQPHVVSSVGRPSRNPRKRNSDAVDLEEASRRWKKARPLLQQSKSTPNPSSTDQKSPLRAITNSAHSALSPRSTISPHKRQHSPTTEFSFVRKVAIGSDEHLRRTQKKPGILMEPSSPARETTPSSSTTATTTQQTVFRDAVLVPAPSPVWKDTKVTQLPTPSSSAERSFTQRQIRKLRKCHLILSPCLVDGDHPLKALLAQHSISHSSFPDHPPSSMSALPADRKDKSNIYVLVDSDSNHVNGKNVWRLVPHIPHWHPQQVLIWDWRLVEAILKDEVVGEAEKTRLAKEHFFAKVSWNPDSEGQGTVEVQWRNWSVSRVSKEELDRLQVIEYGALEVAKGVAGVNGGDLDYAAVLAFWA